MGALEKFNKSFQDPFMSAHSHREPHPKSWNYSLSWLKKKKNRRMACNFWTRKAMFIFQKRAPWRRDCHAGLKSRQKAQDGPWAQHPAPGICLLGRGDALLSLLYRTVSQLSVSKHILTLEIAQIPGSGGRPGMCSLLRAAQGAAGESLSGSSDMSRPSRMGCRVKGLWLKSILHRKIFSKCLTTLWNHTGSVLLSVGVVQTHLCFMWKTRKRKLQLCRASLLYRVSFPSCFPSVLPACRQV